MPLRFGRRRPVLALDVAVGDRLDTPHGPATVIDRRVAVLLGCDNGLQLEAEPYETVHVRRPATQAA